MNPFRLITYKLLKKKQHCCEKKHIGTFVTTEGNRTHNARLRFECRHSPPLQYEAETVAWLVTTSNSFRFFYVTQILG
jgi:hypothetical protein